MLLTSREANTYQVYYIVETKHSFWRERPSHIETDYLPADEWPLERAAAAEAIIAAYAAQRGEVVEIAYIRDPREAATIIWETRRY